MEHHPTQEVKIETLAGSAEGIRLIKVRGPLSINNFFEFQDRSRAQPAPHLLIIDLAETPYIDSAALGCLVGIHVSCDKGGRKYALVNVNERLKRLFAMSGVDQFLVVYDNAAEAEQLLAE